MSEEVQSLEMPTPKPKNRLSLKLSIILALLLAGVCALLFWKLGATLKSQAAIVDGMVYTVSPEISAPLQSLLVQEGSPVEAGQLVARMQVTGYNRDLQEAQDEIAKLAPPDMPEIASRIKAAEAAESDAIARLAGVRHEEEAKQREMEAAVLAHVQAQLAMRTSYDAASKRREAEARKAMEHVKEQFEAASRIRAATSQELARIRYEVEQAKMLASRTRYARQARPAPRQTPPRESGEITAPVTGRVLKISAKNGQNLERGEPLLLILPDNADETFWVKAWFAKSDQAKLRPDLTCKIVRDSDGSVFSGHVESVLPPEPLPGATPGEELVPVRISLDKSTGLLPGDPVSCSLRLPWF